jgi:hypothetical protein
MARMNSSHGPYSFEEKGGGRASSVSETDKPSI